MEHLINYSVFNESKNYQNLYHILNFDKLKYLLKNNKLTPFKAANGSSISLNRDKMMNGYLGDGPVTFFKLEIDANKLSNHYKIRPFSYKSQNQEHFDEREEMVITKNGIVDVDKYITKLIIIKSSLESLMKGGRGGGPSDFYTNVRDFSNTIPGIIKYVYENSPFDLYVQDGSVIKKDDDYIKSIIDYKLVNIDLRYDIWFRGYFKSDRFKYGQIDTMVDNLNNKYQNWFIGQIFKDLSLSDNKDSLDMNTDVKIIEDVECVPYLMKFRIIEGGDYYLEDVRPI